MRTSALTYSPPPRLGRARRDRRRSSGITAARREHTKVTQLITCAVAAVNERGLCLADVAHLAELPPGEVLALAQRCACPTCFDARAN